MGGIAAVTRPENAGTYITLVGQRTVRPAASIAQTVAIPIIHDWGPLGSEEIVKSETFGQFEGLYGDGDTAGRDAVLSAFIGTGVEGKATAGAVKTYRMATVAAKAATITIKNTAGTPADALKLTAIFAGTRGDRISAVVEVDPADSSKHRLRVLFDGVTVERYSYVKANITEAAAKVNANSSRLANATAIASGTALATTSGTALAGGNNGESLTSTEWEDALNALEFEDFSVFVPFDLTDQAIVATLFSWTQSQANEMRPIFTIVGGPAEEELEDAIERVNVTRDPHFISLAGGDFHDDFLEKDVTTSQLAARIAGILAGLGEAQSLLNVPLAGIKQKGTTLIAPDEIATATEQGLTVLRRTTVPNADLVVANGVTTFNSPTDDTRPLELFSDPRIVRVGDLFIRRMKEWGDENIVGPTTVTEETEAAVRDRGQRELNEMIANRLILPGTIPSEAPFFRLVEGSGVQEAIVFEFGFMFARTTKYLIGLGKVR